MADYEKNAAALKRISEKHFDGMNISDDFLTEVSSSLSESDVKDVLAMRIYDLSWDGRISRYNKEWAEIYMAEHDLPTDRRIDLDIHPYILDGIVGMINDYYERNAPAQSREEILRNEIAEKFNRSYAELDEAIRDMTPQEALSKYASERALQDEIVFWFNEYDLTIEELEAINSLEKPLEDFQHAWSEWNKFDSDFTETLSRCMGSKVADIKEVHNIHDHLKEWQTIEPASAREMFYTVDDKYLHVQRTDTDEIDYTIYDQKTFKEIDGGRFESNAEMLTEAALEICADNGFGGEKPLQATDISILEDIQTMETEEILAKRAQIQDARKEKSKEATYKVVTKSGNVKTDLVDGFKTEAEAVEYAESLGWEFKDENDFVWDLDIEESKIENSLSEEKNKVIDSQQEKLAEESGKWQSKFLDSKKDSYCIFQLKPITENAYIRFMNMDYLHSQNKEVSYENYNALYSGKLDEKESLAKTLDSIYEKFNIERPQDFTGHSLSVSDVVALKRDGQLSYHYVDSVGFADVPEFIPKEMLQNMNIEKPMTPVYMHDGAYANEHNELPQYRESYQANVACKEAIENAIGDNYSDNRLNCAGVMEALKPDYSMERIAYVLANTIKHKDWDGRISYSNKEWAKTIDVVPNPDGWGDDRNVYFVVDRAHTGLMDLFATHFRKELEKAPLQTEKPRPSLAETLAWAKQKVDEQEVHKNTKSHEHEL